ncbi:phage tail assembly chaperone [Vibrio parahaemolyticus]|uniref:phage tail assembly chaperone n=1 Tax=Vibrio parahaemolyticus TaxID=670 RepID=UPI002B1FB3FA|nr:phage tail assembly chaperone [Vibrio parahaemolyticus]MEA5377340.1 phage tail assembly chaperone [Vibrio parahaemolyticus]
MENVLEHVNESQLTVIRNRRDMMLRDTDWTQFSDSPLPDDKRQEFAQYRQSLRDVPSNYMSTGEINWPTKPEI